MGSREVENVPRGKNGAGKTTLVLYVDGNLDYLSDSQLKSCSIKVNGKVNGRVLF